MDGFPVDGIDQDSAALYVAAVIKPSMDIHHHVTFAGMLFVYGPHAIRPNALSTKVYCNQLWHLFCSR